MSDVPKIPAGLSLTDDEIESISGGLSCTDAVSIIPKLKEAYDGLVDFTVYVMERVSGK